MDISLEQKTRGYYGIKHYIYIINVYIYIYICVYINITTLITKTDMHVYTSSSSFKEKVYYKNAIRKENI